MKRLLNLFRSNRPAKPAAFRRPQRARLDVEALEERWMPSTSSTAIHAVTDYTGASVAFFNSNGALFEKTDQGLVQAMGMRTSNFNQMSAGLDHNGFAEVYVQTGGNTISFHSDAGGAWQSTTVPTPSSAISVFAAVKGGRMYLVSSDNSVWQFQTPYTETGGIIVNGHAQPITIHVAGGWSEILGPLSFGHGILEAVTDVNNHDNLFGYVGGPIGEFVPGVSTQSLCENSVFRNPAG